MKESNDDQRMNPPMANREKRLMDVINQLGGPVNKETVANGIAVFGQRLHVPLEQPDELLFEAKFPGEPPALIGIEFFGSAISYSTICRVVEPSFAPDLVRRNWGGVDGTCFYFSVVIEDRVPYLVLETRQFLNSTMSAEDIASILAVWRLQWLQAKEAVFNGKSG